VQIGALIARWADRGGDVSLTMDHERTRVVKPLPKTPAVSMLDDDSDDGALGSETVVARAVLPGAPERVTPTRTIASVLADTRRAIQPVRVVVPDGPPPDILNADPGAPDASTIEASMEAELAWLDEQGNLLNRWKRSSAPLQHAVLSWLTARARWAQELLGPGDAAEQVARVYPKLSAFSKRERPGFVYGLRRDHESQGESWMADADSWRTQVTTLLAKEPTYEEKTEGESNPERALARLEEILAGDPEPETVILAVGATLDSQIRPDDPRLLRLVEDHDEALSQDPRFRRLRRALRSFADGDAEATMIVEASSDGGSPFEDLYDDSPEEDSSLGALAERLKILLVGGEPREQHRQRLLDATGVQHLEWAPATRGGGTGKLQSTAESIRRGSWDAVILLPRFCGHDVDAVLVPACRGSGTPWLHVRGGYGVGPIRSAVRELANRIHDGGGDSEDDLDTDGD